VLPFPYGTDGFYLDIPTDVKAKSVTAMEYDCWQLICSATDEPERRTVRRQAVPAVGQHCRRLCENGTAAAKIFAL